MEIYANRLWKCGKDFLTTKGLHTYFPKKYVLDFVYLQVWREISIWSLEFCELCPINKFTLRSLSTIYNSWHCFRIAKQWLQFWAELILLFLWGKQNSQSVASTDSPSCKEFTSRMRNKTVSILSSNYSTIHNFALLNSHWLQ